MAPEPSSTTQLLTAIAAILQAIAWPLVAGVVLFIYKAKIGNLLDIFGKKLLTAKTIKAWQLELDGTTEEIKAVVKKAGDNAGLERMGKIPRSQIQAAEEISAKVRNSPFPETRTLPAVRDQLYSLIDEYDTARRELPSGFVRTKKMTAIVAGFRALSLAAQPLLSHLITEKSNGAHLAAVCILQISPDPDYFDWLIERLNTDNQPFILAQTAIAVLELVQNKQLENRDAARDAISSALHHISSYIGGDPDQNTIEILKTALSKVQ